MPIPLSSQALRKPSLGAFVAAIPKPSAPQIINPFGSWANMCADQRLQHMPPNSDTDGDGD